MPSVAEKKRKHGEGEAAEMSKKAPSRQKAATSTAMAIDRPERDSIELIGAPNGTIDLTGAQAAASLQTTSYDALRQALLNLRSATSLRHHDERLAASDRRIQLAKELVGLGALGGDGESQRAGPSSRGLFDAWDLADAQKQLAILPLPLFVIANLLTLLGTHQPDHELAESIIAQLLPQSTLAENVEQGARQATSRTAGKYWQRLQEYLTSADNLNGGYGATAANGKGKAVQRSSRDIEVLTLATLRLLLAMTSFAGARYGRAVFDSTLWTRKSLARLATKRRRVFVNKRDRKALAGRPNPQVTLDRPDIRTLWVLLLLSFLRTPSGSCTPANLRMAALGLGKEYYPAIVKGLSQDPAPIVAHILLGFHDGILSDEAANKLPRSSTVSLLNEWSCKDLLSLYEREGDMLHINGVEDSHSVADVAHHFLLAMCTHPGRGVCYIDNGWYGRLVDNEEGAMDETEDQTRNRPAIHNKILHGIMRSLSPAKSPKQNELALRILGASSELVGLQLAHQVQLEPRAASLSWLSTATFIGRIMSLPLPDFRRPDGQWMAKPPPAKICMDNLLPACLTRSVLTRAATHSDRLTRFSGLTLLLQLVKRLLSFKSICLHASGSQKVVRDDGSAFVGSAETMSLATEDAVLRGSFGFESRAEHPWHVRWTEVITTAKERLPDVLALLDSLDVDGGPQSKAVGESQDASDTRKRHESTLRELALRAAWQQTELLGLEQEELAQGAVDKIVKAALDDGDEYDSAGREEALTSLRLASRLHALRILWNLSQLPSRPLDLCARASGSSQTYLRHLLEMQTLTKSSPALLNTARNIVSTTIANSTLFADNPDEWQAWDYALEGASRGLVAFLDECLQRCLKTPYRYVELGRRLTSTAEATVASTLPSPLLFAMLEQWCVRIKKGLLDEEAVLPLQVDFLLFLGDLLPSIGVLCPDISASVVAICKELQETVASCTVASSDVLFALEILYAKVDAIYDMPRANRAELRQKGSARPYNMAKLQDLMSSASLSPQIESSLHPRHENLVDSVRSGQSLPSRTAAFHCAYATKGFDHIDWHSTTSLGASMLFEVAKRTSLRTGDCTYLQESVTLAFEHGLFDVTFVGENLLTDVAVLGVCQSNETFFEALVDLAVVVFGEATDDKPHDYVKPLWTLAEQSESRLCAKLVGLLPSQERSRFAQKQLQENDTAALREASLTPTDASVDLRLVSQAVTALGELDARRLESIVGRLSNTAITIADATQEERNVSDACNVIDVILSSSLSTGVDAALSNILSAVPQASAYLLQHSAAKRFFAPFAANRALSNVLGDGDREQIPVDGLLKMAATSIFASVAIATASARFMEQGTALDASKVLDTYAQVMPDKPAEAFRTAALLLAASLGRLEQARPVLISLAEKSLLHLVRRFAEDAEDSAETVSGVVAFTGLLRSVPALCDKHAHLVEPVLTAALKNRATSPIHLALVRELLPSSSLSRTYRQACLDNLLRSVSSSHDSIVFDESVSCVHASMAVDPAVLTQAFVRSLIRLYGGTLAVRDRKILHILQSFEQMAKTSILDLLAPWSPPMSDTAMAVVDDHLSTSHTLWKLDATRIHGTCLKFPRARGSGDIIRCGYDETGDDGETLAASVYDPLLVLACIGAVLAEDSALTASQCLELLKSSSIGLLLCSLSSQHQDLRLMSATLLAQVYGAVQRADFFEKDQVLVVLDGIRNAYHFGQADDGGNIAPLPLTTTLFAAHALRAIATPSVYLYPSISRFLLQRAAPLDQSDVPLLYSFLYSSSLQSAAHRQERLFILRFVTACVRFGGSTDWRIMKRRHVWPAVCSLYAAVSDVTLQQTIESFWLAAARKSPIATSVVLRQSFLVFVQQQTLAMRAQGRMGTQEIEYWLQLVGTLFSALDAGRMFEASGTTWCVTIIDILQDVVESGQPELSEPALASVSQFLDSMFDAFEKHSINGDGLGEHHTHALSSLHAIAHRSHGSGRHAFPGKATLERLINESRMS